MDKYCIKILELVLDYEIQNKSGIGMSVLDRKFYREFSFSEAYLTDKIKYLKDNEYLNSGRPYSITEKGRQVLES